MSDLQFEQVANIKVFGIGGGGCNAVNRMVSEGVKGVEFYVANTDLQALNISPVENKIVLGREVTKGLGAGANPEMGRRAAQENENEIRELSREAIWYLSLPDWVEVPEQVLLRCLRKLQRRRVH